MPMYVSICRFLLTFHSWSQRFCQLPRGYTFGDDNHDKRHSQVTLYDIISMPLMNVHLLRFLHWNDSVVFELLNWALQARALEAANSEDTGVEVS